MSAPQIPNLLSLRGARGGRLRGRGRGGQPGSATPTVSHDVTIQGTDSDAAVSRLSCVELGYLDDPFARFFVQNPADLGVKRLPIINRGTYTRTKALDSLISSFLAVPANFQGSCSRQRQIISLGAGTDTRCFRLFEDRPAGLIYHELDFPVTTAKKLQIVRATAQLRGILNNPTPDGSGGSRSSSSSEEHSWRSDLPGDSQYWCHGIDLRNLLPQDHQQQQPAPVLPGLRTDVPTLILSECCLCYLEPREAQGILSFFSDHIPALAAVIYEPVRPDDAFGRMMVSNLAARRIRMPTLEEFRTPADQEARLRAAGFETVYAVTVERVWEGWIAPAERERVDGLEGLDEVEEWKLLADHYVVAWGSRGDGFAMRSEAGG